LPALCEAGAGDYAGQINALIPAATRNAKPTKVKDDLQWNDLLKTEKSGRLRAGLADGSILSLGSNSELKVVQHDATSQQTSLEMNFGKVRSKVVKITQPNGKFEMKTPNAVIGVVGTDFYVGYEANRTTVICYTGQVMVTPAGNAKIVRNSGENNADNSIAVSAGQMVIISTEIPPAGFQSDSTPSDVLKSSMLDTEVPDGPPPALHPHLVRNLIYPVANPQFPFLGLHFTRLIHGGIEAGPNAVLAFAREGYTFSTINPGDLLDALLFPGLWRFLRKYPGMVSRELGQSLSKNRFCHALQRLVPEIRPQDLEAGGAGVRAQAMSPSGELVQDFQILARDNALPAGRGLDVHLG